MTTTPYCGPTKIISGGQTGVDQGALAFAKARGLQTGGMLPKYCRTETGLRPDLIDLYQMDVSNFASYDKRTHHNVLRADFTLILCYNGEEPGVLLTRKYCQQLNKPFGLYALDVVSVQETVIGAADWLMECEPAIMNVAGSRASKWPGAEEQTRELLTAIYSRISLMQL